MEKDEQAWTAMVIQTSDLECGESVGYAVKRMSEKLALGLLDKLSDGKEYAVKMISPQTIPNIERGETEIRTAMSMCEIVRCKDCVNAQHREPGMVYCPRMIGSWVEDDWFCADGERRTE